MILGVEKLKKEDLPDGCEVDVPIDLNKKIKQGPCFELFREFIYYQI